MEFPRLAERQVFEKVQECTSRMRHGDVPHPAIPDILRRHGVDLDRSVVSFLGVVDDDLYSGTLVSQDRRVLEFVIDTSVPGESTVEDVTDQLGPKDPRHPRSDIKDVITMSLHWFDHLPARSADLATGQREQEA